jgi:hypothetical protein
MVSSIIMDGAEDRTTMEEARKVAKKEAIKLSKNKTYGKSDPWVMIDKFTTKPQHRSVLLESWRYTRGKFICEKEK